MKRIVIACDGTWKRADAAHPTNVVKTAQAVLPQAPDGTAQLTLHLDGVGTGRGTGALARGLDRALGGAFGLGLMAVLADAYRALVFNHAPGDAIYLFGYSRGAFLARSLAGLIRTAGVLERTEVAAIPEALELYRRRGPGAGPESDTAAQRFAPGIPAASRRTSPISGSGTRWARSACPGRLRLAALANRGLRFHDTALSRHVRAARHAVAIDERRRAFPPTLWDNLAALNGGAADGPYQQRWFPGDHGSVGGGGPSSALSDDAALWVIEGAAAAGLAFDPAALARMAAGRDWRGPLAATRPGLIGALLGRVQADRAGPADPDELAAAAVARWRADRSYRPRALSRVAAALGEAEAPIRAPGRGWPGSAWAGQRG